MAIHTVTYEVDSEGVATLSSPHITVQPGDEIKFHNASSCTLDVTLPSACFDAPLTHVVNDGDTKIWSIRSDAEDGCYKYEVAASDCPESTSPPGDVLPEMVPGEITVTN